ncbi:MAG TPA: transcriptional regulator [Pseudonocardiaceae bacterium]
MLAEAGFELTVQPFVTFVDQVTTRGRPFTVPTTLPRLPLDRAFVKVVLPVYLNWSAPGRQFDLRDRAQRARVYEIVLREGASEDLLAYVDGALLIDLWDELVIPRDIRAAWTPLIEDSRTVAAQR